VGTISRIIRGRASARPSPQDQTRLPKRLEFIRADLPSEPTEENLGANHIVVRFLSATDENPLPSGDATQQHPRATSVPAWSLVLGGGSEVDTLLPEVPVREGAEEETAAGSDRILRAAAFQGSR